MFIAGAVTGTVLRRKAIEDAIAPLWLYLMI